MRWYQQKIVVDQKNDSEFRGTIPSGKCKKGSHGLILVETLANTLNNEPPTNGKLHIDRSILAFSLP